ncbi:nucleotidyltransferase family protein [Thalassotalea euphylliae]|uniref:nucleotidyltransferase family protein n=1 Tax=Thalassotalea euphylliae TaxID=1655234 RepID=UPI00363BE776
MNYLLDQTFYQLADCLSGRLSSEDMLSLFKVEDTYLGIIELANQYWLTGHLVSALRTANILHCLSEEVSSYLQELEQVYIERAYQIGQELSALNAHFKAQDITAIAFKGAHALLAGISQPASIRFMKDIDLILAVEHLEQAQNVLVKRGYVAEEESAIVEDSHHHVAPLLNPAQTCFVELHRAPLRDIAHAILPESLIWKNAEFIENNDGQVLNNNACAFRGLTPTHQVIVCIAHNEISDRAYDSLHIDMQQITNLYLLVKSYEQEIDWHEVSTRFQLANRFYALEFSLFVLKELFKIDTPITPKQSTELKGRLERAIKRYVDAKPGSHFLPAVRAQLAMYAKHNIKANFGENHSLILGWVKQFGRHILQVANPSLLKRFFDANR